MARMCPDCGVRELDYHYRYCSECVAVRKYLTRAIYDASQKGQANTKKYETSEKGRARQKLYLKKKKLRQMLKAG